MTLRQAAILIALLKMIFLAALSVAAQRTDKDESFLRAVFPGNDLQSVKALIAAGANVNAKEKYTGRTALFYAISSGNKELVRVLLDAGINVNATAGAKATALMSCYDDCTADVVRMIVAKGANVNAKDKDGNTALIRAAVFENADALQALIESGADVNAKNKKGITSLMRASGARQLPNIKVLLAAGADLDARDTDGWTALKFAQNENDQKVIQAFAEYRNIKRGDTTLVEGLQRINNITRCEENSDRLYNRRDILERLAAELNSSSPGYKAYEPNGFYVNEDDRPRYFFVFDLTDPSNRGTSLSCVDFKNNHVYHFAAHYIPFSLSHIVALEAGKLRIFRSLNCGNSSERLGEVIGYLNQQFNNQPNKGEIIERVKNYRKFGLFTTVDDTYIRCTD